MFLPFGSTAISSGSGPDSSWRLTSDVGVDHVHDVAVAGGNEQLLEVGLSTMPRGRRATLMVLMISSVSLSTTVMVLSFSLETKMVAAKAWTP